MDKKQVLAYLAKHPDVPQNEVEAFRKGGTVLLSPALLMSLIQEACERHVRQPAPRRVVHVSEDKILDVLEALKHLDAVIGG